MNQVRTTSPSARGKRWRRWIRWGSGLALLALVPKCLVCVAAYVGLGALLGLTGPEICGATTSRLPAGILSTLAVSVAVGALMAWRHRKMRSSSL